MYDPTYRRYPYTLNNIPAPPPPPVDVHEKRLIRMLFIVIVLLGIIIGVSIVAVNKAVTSVQITPTIPAYRSELLAVDFPTFIDGFKQTLKSSDWQALASIEDGNNFKEYCVMADTSCTNDWNTTYTQLTKNELRLAVPGSFNYTNEPGLMSLCQKTEKEAGNDWIYVDGTYSQSAYLVVPNDGSAIFGFEQHKIGGRWMWETLFLHWSNC